MYKWRVDIIQCTKLIGLLVYSRFQLPDVVEHAVDIQPVVTLALKVYSIQMNRSAALIEVRSVRCD